MSWPASSARLISGIDRVFVAHDPGKKFGTAGQHCLEIRPDLFFHIPRLPAAGLQFGKIGRAISLNSCDLNPIKDQDIAGLLRIVDVSIEFVIRFLRSAPVARPLLMSGSLRCCQRLNSRQQAKPPLERTLVFCSPLKTFHDQFRCVAIFADHDRIPNGPGDTILACFEKTLTSGVPMLTDSPRRTSISNPTE